MNGKLLGQAHSEEILRTALEKYSCFVELDTELVSFEQTAQDVTAQILKRQDGQEVSETVKFQFLVGTDGAHGVTRKALGLTFLGETRNSERIVIGDVYVEGLDTDVSTIQRFLGVRCLRCSSILALAYVGRCLYRHVRRFTLYSIVLP